MNQSQLTHGKGLGSMYGEKVLNGCSFSGSASICCLNKASIVPAPEEDGVTNAVRCRETGRRNLLLCPNPNKNASLRR